MLSTLMRRVTVVATVLVGTVLVSPAVQAGAASGNSPAMATSPGLAQFPDGTDPDDLPIAVGWGSPQQGGGGYLGPDESTKLTPVTLNGGDTLDKEVSLVDPGYSAACMLVAGKAYCWGMNNVGQLGTELAINSSIPPIPVGGVLADKPVSAISVGGSHTCAISEGKAYCWGRNTYGQVGNNAISAEETLPVPVFADGGLANKTVSAISAGYNHTCAIADGEVYCWGRNHQYQLGDGTKVNRSAPALATHPNWAKVAVTSISAGGAHTCALTSGRAYCWGENALGETGSGNFAPAVQVPTAVSSSGVLFSLTVKAISAGNHLTCAIAGTTNTRRAFCWGRGTAGALGNGNTNNSAVPVTVSTPAPHQDRVSSISADLGGGCLVAQGTGYCWGAGGAGRLGTGLVDSSSVPISVSTDVPGSLNGRRLLTVSAQTYYTTGIAVTPKGFTDVSSNHPFADDIEWAWGVGLTHGNPDNTFGAGADISRQAMAAFLFRYANPGKPAPACGGNIRIFTDVPKSSSFCGAVEWLATSKIATVPWNKVFAPASAVTRGAMADWIYRTQHPLLADQVCKPGPRLFADVTFNTVACGNIEWLSKTGVTSGYADDTYHPNDPISRQAMVAFLHRARELTAH